MFFGTKQNGKQLQKNCRVRNDKLYYSVENMDYWFEIHGEGIPIVLLHGFTGSSTTWHSLIQRKYTGFKFITIDLPGHGLTKGKTVKTMEACCRDLHQLFQELGLNKFFLAGYSMGGRTALSYAVKYPKSIQGLLLESASPGLQIESERKTRIENDRLLAERIEREGIKAFVNYWENIALFSTQKFLTKEKQEVIRRERLSHTAEGLANSLQGMGTGAQASEWENLHMLTFPVLLIAGGLDKKFVKLNKRMQELFPNAALKVCENAGHAVHLEKPQIFNELLVEFAKSHAS